MRRIYFLVPDLATTQKIVAELRDAGIPDRHMHVIAKPDIPLGDLPEASMLEKTDFIPAVERGAALGGATGLLAGLFALRFAGFAIAGGPLLGILFYGATIGAIISGLIGVEVDNTRIRGYAAAIAAGELLVMVDVAKERIEEFHQLVIMHHPSAEFAGLEPLLPPGYY